METNRREFITNAFLLATGLKLSPALSLRTVSTSEKRFPTNTAYGFITCQAPALSQPEAPNSSVGVYAKNALLRFSPTPIPGIVEVIHDSWHNRPDALMAREKIYIPSDFVRRIGEAELWPISTDVPMSEKWIDVNLSEPQSLSLHEGGRLRYRTLISSGLRHLTPTGEHKVSKRQLSRHMQARPGRGTWDHPGVGLVLTFGGEGEAFHIAYWHNNFGHPMSSGCINMNKRAATFLWRWINPRPYDFEKEWEDIEKHSRVTTFIHY